MSSQGKVVFVAGGTNGINGINPEVAKAFAFKSVASIELLGTFNVMRAIEALRHKNGHQPGSTLALFG